MRALACSGLLVLGILLHPARAAAETDIFGRTVPDLHGRPYVVLFANHTTQDAVDDPMTDFTFRLRDVDPVVVVRVDLRGLPSIFEGIAKRIMRSEYNKGIEKYFQQCRQAGLPVPSRADAEAAFFMIPESYGSSHQAAGLKKGFSEALAIAYDAHGHELARVAFPRQVEALEAALRTATHRPAPK